MFINPYNDTVRRSEDIQTARQVGHKRLWSAQDTASLLLGIRTCGVGKWKQIVNFCHFADSDPSWQVIITWLHLSPLFVKNAS